MERRFDLCWRMAPARPHNSMCRRLPCGISAEAPHACRKPAKDLSEFPQQPADAPQKSSGELLPEKASVAPHSRHGRMGELRSQTRFCQRSGDCARTPRFRPHASEIHITSAENLLASTPQSRLNILTAYYLQRKRRYSQLFKKVQGQ